MKVIIPSGTLLWATPGAASIFPYPGLLGIGVFLTESGVPMEINYDGYLQQGPTGFLNEKACRHEHLEGNAIAFSPQNVIVESIGYPADCKPDDGPVTRQFRAFKLGYKPYRTTRSSGPIRFNTLGSGYTERITPYEDTDFRYSDITLEYTVHSDSLITYRHRYTRIRKTTQEVYHYDFQKTSEVDLPNKRWRYQGVTRWTYFDAVAFTPPLDFDFPRTRDQFSQLHTRLDRKFQQPNDEAFYGDLVRRAANDAQVLDTNMLEMTRELISMKATIKSIVVLMRSTASVKNIAKAFLTYQYGPRLTVSDGLYVVRQLQSEYRRVRSIVRRSRAKEKTVLIAKDRGEVLTCSCEYNYKIAYFATSDDWRDFFSNWFNSGFFPTLQSTWDLVPYSFVVDWFLKADKYLDAIDANTYWSLHSILGAVYSKKTVFRGLERMFSNSQVTFIGDISAVFYSRDTSRTLHRPLYFESTPRYFKNYAELTALLIARRR